eukprot:PhF_6_TR10408/c0_g1_i5/m.16321
MQAQKNSSLRRSATPKHSSGTSSQNNDIGHRLYDEHKTISMRKDMMQSRKDEECTFQPQINPNAGRGGISDNNPSTQVFEHLYRTGQEKLDRMQRLQGMVETEEGATHQPAINPTSRALAEVRPHHYSDPTSSRLNIHHSEESWNTQDNTFRPTINPKSAALDRNTNAGTNDRVALLHAKYHGYAANRSRRHEEMTTHEVKECT